MSRDKNSKSSLNKSLIRTLIISTMGIVGVTSAFSAFATNKNIHICYDGVDRIINTSIQDTQTILEQQNIKINDEDVIIRDDYTEEHETKITVKRAYGVPIISDGVKVSINIAQGTVNDALYNANIHLFPNDKVVPSLDTTLFNGINIEVFRQKSITLVVNGVEGKVIVREGTVKEVLDSMDIVIEEYDELNVDPNQNVVDDMKIVLDKISFSEEKQEEKIPYETLLEKSNGMYEGETKIKTPGSEGIRELTICKKTVNGEIVETNIVNEIILKEPQNEIKLIGTKKKAISSGIATISNENGSILDHHGSKVFYAKKLSGVATAYTANVGDKTSTGELAQFGKVAVNPKIIPYGTKLYICSEDGSFVYGYATASDTGGALMSGHALVDLFYPTNEECIRFGRRKLSIYVL